jgi:putative transport protein
MDYVVRALRENPELAVFLTLAVGFLIGRLKIGSFSLGTVVGTLLAGVLIGQLDIKVPSTVKSIFFLLFLFSTGYKVGPQFFRGLKRDAIPQMALTVVLCVTCLLTAFAFAKLLGYDIGTAAGLLAGAFSESTVIGTAGDAIQRLGISSAEKTALMNNIPVAYAVTYLIGAAAVVWFLPTMGPKLMGINLREEGARQQAEIAGSAELGLGVMSAARHFDIRAYRVANTGLANKTVGELEALPKDARIFVVRLRRGEEILETTPTTVIRQNDVVAVAARQEIHVERGTGLVPRWTTRPCSTSPSRPWTWWSPVNPSLTRPCRNWRSSKPPVACFCESFCGQGRRFPFPPERALTAATCCAWSGRGPKSSARRRSWGIPTVPPRRRT